MGVRIYKIDEVDERLELMPMAARRALDRAGVRISLKSWQGSSLSARRTLTALGSGLVVDVAAVDQWIEENDLERQSIEPVAEPSALATPAEVQTAFGGKRPIPVATWAALSPLDRSALIKVAQESRPERLQRAYEEIVGQSAHSTHLAPGGGVRMVNVSGKTETHRVAVARSAVSMNQAAFDNLAAGDNPKGDVLGTARLAGIMAAKRTADFIPLCHPVRITKVHLTLERDAESRSVLVTGRVECIDRTGVEMEALTAVSVAALTVYDMLKAFDKGMTIGPTELCRKSGGRSGDFRSRSEVTVAGNLPKKEHR